MILAIEARLTGKISTLRLLPSPSPPIRGSKISNGPVYLPGTIQILATEGEQAWILGEITEASDGEDQVELQGL